MVADEYDLDRSGEKSVSFSSEDEILEIAPRKIPQPQNRGQKLSARINLTSKHVKERLG